MMKKNKLKNIAGITLIEIMIGVVISAIMMGAMYTTYSLVNNSYSQVTDRAKISRSGRDIIAMLMRDIRLAGFKYYFGENAADIPKQDNLWPNTGSSDIEKSHDPIIVIENELGDATDTDSTDTDSTDTDSTDTDSTDTSTNKAADDKCCDKIHIVYGDFNQNDKEQPYKRYRVTYYAKTSGDGEYYGVYKSKQSWIQGTGEGEWIIDGCAECFSGELIRDHLVDMEFIVFNKQGKIINPPPRPDASSRANLYNIKAVDIRLTFRSKNKFYRFEANEEKPRLVKGLGERNRKFLDRYLRDSVVVTVNTRNIGS